MEIKGVGAFTGSVKPAGKPQPPAAAEDPAVKGSVSVQTPAAGASAGRPRVRAKDLLSEDEQRFLESLFPGATDGAGAVETYAGQGRPGALPPGTLVDRKG
jgi:hypothetical protein